MNEQPSPPQPPSRWLAALKLLAAAAVLVALVEGAANLFYSGYLLFVAPVRFMAEERSHTEYDSLLGWVHRPNLDIPDMYGPGVFFRTNSQRLRADRDYTPDVPRGRKRVVCSGDSFALGHSVSNEQTWCAQLEALNPSIEPVNMGQAAYGIDQAFLWYRRDGGKLRHDVHLFSFITNDFQRMMYDNFGGYPKPYLRLADTGLIVKNVPVPTQSLSASRKQRIRDAIGSLRTVQLTMSVLRRTGIRRPTVVQDREVNGDEVRRTAAKVFEELKRLNAERGSTLALVFLPQSGDGYNRTADPWRAFVSEQSTRLGIAYVDLVEEFRKMPISTGEELFVAPYTSSHLTARGNAWLAQRLYEHLLNIPDVRTALGAARHGP